MKRIILYHGSNREVRVEDIKFPGPRPDCDFGRGFYATPHAAIAEEWVRKELTPVINMYEFLYKEEDTVTLLDTSWLKAVIGCREGLYKVTFIKNIIIGAIADDRMNEALPAFLTNSIFSIGDKRLFECLTLVKLGDQFVLKNNTNGLTFIKSYILKGKMLQDALQRHDDRRHDMKRALEGINRKQYPDEKFLDDYVKECKNGIAF